ncbi:MAG: D-tyrosyl-tRNA(Tyr) deacylase [Acidobacteria bacterium SCN 69-37]|nr:MAG: D-tyrosyl-tRNA(Tyr) deacylase [Acidobacteria bacterium SCN 69-37]
MRAVVQRVSQASVTVDGTIVGAIEAGLLVLLGVAEDDGPADIAYVASKVAGLRVFRDEAGRMNRSVTETGGALLVVSQFTLLGDVRRGRRPAFDMAASPSRAHELYDAVVDRLRRDGLTVATGRFQADMRVALVNDGPVTILIDSRRTF